MTTSNAIKWRPTWKFWIPITLFLLPLILERELIGTSYTPYAYCIFLIAYGIIYSLRTKLWQATVFAFMMAMAICIYFLAARPGRFIESIELLGIVPGANFSLWLETYINMPVWFGILAINTFVFFTLGPIIAQAIEMERAAIRLFKLAARQIIDVQNGYTDRPFIAGNHHFSNNELVGLALFLESKRICLAHYPDKGIKLLFSMGISPLCKRYRDRISYVMFTEGGKLSVFISENDYKQYRRQYTFDQLCEKMGNTFLRFAEDYKNHNEKRILTELKGA